MPNSKAIGTAYSDPELDGALVANSTIGRSSADTIGFYGAAKIAQRQSSAVAAVVTTAAISSSTSATCFGYTSAQATAIVALVNELRAAAVALGLIAN